MRGSPHSRAGICRMCQAHRMAQLMAGDFSHVGRSPEKAIHAFVEDEICLNEAAIRLTGNGAGFTRVPTDSGNREDASAADWRVKLAEAIGERNRIRIVGDHAALAGLARITDGNVRAA